MLGKSALSIIRRMEFKLIATENGLRSGNIENTSGLKLETPLCFLYTKAGCVPYLARDVLNRLNLLPQFLQMPADQFSDQTETLKLYGKGLDHFTANEDMPIFCSIVDPCVETPHNYSDIKGVALWSRSGKTQMHAEQFMSFMENAKPTWFQALRDSETQVGKNRVRKCVDRTLNYLDECIDLLSKSEKLSHAKILGSIVGGSSEREIIRSATETAKRDVHGFCLEGFHDLGHSVDNFDLNAAKDIIQSVLELLPSSKVRMLPGAYSPQEVVEAYKMGIDLFDCSYPCLVTRGYSALNFNLSLEDPVPSDVVDEEENILHLSLEKYATEFIPITKGCTCYACTQHSRGYIRHLLNNSEILGRILLTIHNIHQYFGFFTLLREAASKNLIHKLEQNLNSRITPKIPAPAMDSIDD